MSMIYICVVSGYSAGSYGTVLGNDVLRFIVSCEFELRVRRHDLKQSRKRNDQLAGKIISVPSRPKVHNPNNLREAACK
jgi:hypothetical protein